MPTGYIGEFEIVDDHRAGKVVVSLLGESLPPLVVSLGLCGHLWLQQDGALVWVLLTASVQYSV